MDSTTIFLFFVFACVGAAAGGLIERSLNKRRTKASPPPAESQSASNALQPKGEPLPPQDLLAAEGDVEVLRAWRTKAGKIWLEMDRTRLDDKGALQADQRRKLLNLVVDLRPWLETAAEAAPSRPLQARATALSPTKPSPAAVAAAEQKPGDGKPKINMKSIVEQIDDVLQTKLAGTVFESQDIHLMESPGGGVTVQIDREKYEGVDAVPNPEIQALIRQAVAAWEKGPK